ncbi:tip elongation aberrant protein 1-like [Homarus americanus]|uniref:tip elongation aberrant protein 1-like n=1 Tax=Homarus americanus TaxID=6706 RepID=UPI001C436F4A|nr:tip elongation aberrant protein 1-like [Homarus americanus]XP_042229747.1 tip elongation aberrant protein 1-like [Homarus americanus]
MWSSVVGVVGSEVPSARHKHAVCTDHPHVYLLGGRHGNLPLKDFWIYDLMTRAWREVREDTGSRPPTLQQHTMIKAGDKFFVFGGELCMSNETPLWIYIPQTKVWRKWRWEGRGRGVAPACGGRGLSGGASGPTGRRGHTALMIGDSMLIYGGYQDLRGSSAELWSFNTQEETWTQLSSRGEQPAPRHAHSAVMHDQQMWVYGGMTDLQERNDFWRYDTASRTWTQVRARPNPGYLHSHVAAKLHSCMIVFGGERQGEMLNDLWRFHFATSTWERLVSSGIRPQPRSQFCAFVAPSHHIKGPRFHTPSSRLGSSSAASSSSHSSSGYSSSHSHDSYRTRKVHPDDSLNSGGASKSSGGKPGGMYEGSGCACKECVDADNDDDLDPSRLRSLIQRNCSNAPTAQLKLSISKFSQLNLSHLGRYYSYSMLSNDSTESIVEESLASTCDSLGSKIVKSQSIHVMNKDKNGKSNGDKSGMTRDIVSVPNFGDIKDSEEDNTESSQMPVNHVKVITVMPAEGSTEASLEDDSSDLVAGIKGRLAFNHDDTIQSADTSISENLMSFSCTTDSNLSSNTNLHSTSNYNMSGVSSFANPNYVGFDPGRDSGGLLSQDYWTTRALDLESIRHKEFAELLRTPPDSGIGLGVEMERRTPLDLTLATLEDFVTFDNQTARFNKTRTTDHPAGTNGTSTHKPTSTAKVTFSSSHVRNSGESSGQNSQRHSEDSREPPAPRINPFIKEEPSYKSQSPSAMYIVGGKEMDQMTAFRRPISVWKLDLPF